MFTSQTINFHPVKVRGNKSLPCPKCNKKVPRRHTFQETINPWNKNEDGSVKSEWQVRQSVMATCRKWELEPVICNKCKVITP